MSEWKTYKLGEVCRYCTNRIKILDNYISTENMLPDKGGICESTNVPSGNAVEYKIGDVLISNIRPYFKKIWHANCDGSCSPDILCIRSESMINDTYLYYLLSQQIFFDYVMLGAKGCKMPRGDKDHIMKWELMLPPIKIQEQIAEILSSLDDKIDLLQRENDTLEALAESLFRERFIEKESEEWKEGTLNDILSVKGGATPSTSNPLFWNGDIYWTSPRDITTLKGIYLFDTERKITSEGLSKISSGLLPKGTLLMSSRAPVGVLAFAEIPIAINQGYIAVLDDKGYSKEFLYLLLKANMETIHNYSNGSTFMEISKASFKSIEVAIPPIEMVEQFTLDIRPYFQKIKANTIQIQTLTNTRDTLLPKLMSGEVEID